MPGPATPPDETAFLSSFTLHFHRWRPKLIVTVQISKLRVCRVPLLGFAQFQKTLVFNAFTVITQKNLCCKLQLIQCKCRECAWIIPHVCKQIQTAGTSVTLGKKCVHEMLHLPCWQWPWSNSAI